MTFSEKYLTHLKVLENVGMTSIEPIEFEGQMIQPIHFLKAVLLIQLHLDHVQKVKQTSVVSFAV